MIDVFEKIKVSSGQIPVIFFNASGTLIHYQQTFEEVYSKVCSDLGIPISPKEAELLLNRVRMALAERAERSEEISWNPSSWIRLFLEQAQIKHTNMDLVVKQISQNLGKHLTASIPQLVAEVCLELRQRGFRLGVISNWNGILADFLRDHLLLDFFDAVITSYDLGISKPDSQIFFEALGEFEMDAQNVAMVGSSFAFDISPAKKLGMKPVLYDPQLLELRCLQSDEEKEEQESKVVRIETLKRNRALEGVTVIRKFDELLEIFV